MFKNLIFTYFVLTNSLLASDILIAVAANVSYAIDDLKKEFNKNNPDINVKVILGSSGKLTAQIHNGAPYELFMSANMQYPQKLYKDGLTTSIPVVYAKGALSIFSIKKRNFNAGINILEDNNIVKIAIANPKTAPYGKATLKVFQNTNIYDKIEKKLIYAESISQTISYTIIAADIGIIAKSALFGKHMSKYKKGINFIDIDTKLYTPIEQGIVMLKTSQNKADTKLFYEFILSNKAKSILKKYGYII